VRGALRLGARLFWSTPEQRRRSLLVILATALGEFAMLTVLSIAAAGLSTPGAQSNAPADRLRLLLAIVLAISLPVLTLAASVARFSAGMRDRRLANLRLLGLAPVSTRMVAAVEIVSAPSPARWPVRCSSVSCGPRWRRCPWVRGPGRRTTSGRGSGAGCSR